MRSLAKLPGVLAAVLLFCLAPDLSAQTGTKPFPDEWFFGGTSRPGELRALEGKPAPELSIDTWIGDEVTVAGCRGKVVVVDFWATWCGPCMAAIPHNIELVEEHTDDGLVFVGVHDANAGWDRAPRVVRERAINYSVGKDDAGESVKRYALQFWPTYVVIDRSGVVRAAGLTPDRVDDVVEILLAEAPPDPGEAARPEEFEPAFYYGGESRPASLRAMEGRPAPKLDADAWAGLEPAGGVMDDSVVVLTFVSPSLTISMHELDKVAALEPELGPQGVVFVGICDGTAPWEPIEARAESGSLPIPVMRDAVEEREGEDGETRRVGMTAAAFGVEYVPVTVILDRSGTVRAAGVRAEKIREIVEKLLGEAGDRVPQTGPGDEKERTS